MLPDELPLARDSRARALIGTSSPTPSKGEGSEERQHRQLGGGRDLLAEGTVEVFPHQPADRTGRKTIVSGTAGDALDETVGVTIDGRRRTITKREAIVTQMVDKSASADLRATKMLIDIMQRRGAQGRRRCPAARTSPAGRGGQEGGTAVRRAVAAADPAR